MARPVWSGSISFGLVNVGVKAYTAVRDHTIHFNQLEKETGARIRHQDISDETGKPVDRDDMELGYEVSKGRYVTFERDEIDELRPESTKTVEVTDFVDLEEVDPIYYQRTYWLGPSSDTDRRAYQLLLAAMEEREQVAIGTVVMRNKQYLAAIRPLDGALAMSTMRFADEVVPKADLEEVPSRRAKPKPKELQLALQIVDSLSGEWKPEQYHDTYTETLEDLIEKKDKGEEVVVEETPAQEAKVLDLMAALEASVDAAKKGRTSKARANALAEAAERLAEEAEGGDDEGSSTSAAKGRGRRTSAKKGATTKKRSSRSKAPSRKKSA